MRTALILFTAYASALTAGIFSSERSLTKSLERELSQRVSAELEASPIVHFHTLFSGIVFDDIDARIRSEQPVSGSQNMLSVATITACNTRISPCF